MEIAICIGLALSSIILSGIAITLSCVCMSIVTGLKNSTHQIQYVPLEDEKGNPIEGDKLDENMEKAFSEEYTEREYI